MRLPRQQTRTVDTCERYRIMAQSPIILNKFLNGVINSPRLEATEVQKLIEVLPKPVTHPVVNLKIEFKDFVGKACLK